MNRIFKISALLFVLVSLVVTSCNKSASDASASGNERFVADFGQIVGDQNAFNIKTDEGRMLYVVENKVPSFPVQDGQHVVVNYTLLTPRADGYEVRINALENMLTKDPLYSSDLTAEKLERLGSDPIEVSQVRVAGKYLYVMFDPIAQKPLMSHLVNLVVEESLLTKEQSVLRLYHNTYEDSRPYVSLGRVSFDLSQLVPKGKTQINIQVRWIDYNRQEHTYTALYKYTNPERAESENGAVN